MGEPEGRDTPFDDGGSKGESLNCMLVKGKSLQTVGGTNKTTSRRRYRYVTGHGYNSPKKRLLKNRVSERSTKGVRPACWRGALRDWGVATWLWGFKKEDGDVRNYVEDATNSPREGRGAR